MASHQQILSVEALNALISEIESDAEDNLEVDDDLEEEEEINAENNEERLLEEDEKAMEEQGPQGDGEDNGRESSGVSGSVSIVVTSTTTTPTASPTPSTSRAESPASERLTPVEEKSRKRRKGALQPARGAPIQHIGDDVVEGHDGTRWHRDPNPTLPHMFAPKIEPGGPTTVTLGVRKVSDIFSLFLDDCMLAEIVLHTNVLLAFLRDHLHQKDNVALRDIDLRELKALIGILIMSAIRSDHHTPTSDMWDLTEGNSLYLCTMTEHRFALLLRVLRFDDSATRSERKKEDRLAAIRMVFDHVVANCKKNYSPGPHLTVDEHLVPFRGCCPFKMYIPNKPAKFGMKLVMVCDADTNYMCNAIAYLGKDTVKVPRGKTLGEVFTTELLAPFQRRGRTVTTDNFFTQLPLSLALDDNGMHLCGTIRQKPYIPKELFEKVLPVKVSVAIFNYEHNLTLQCQQVSKTKKVMLLRSLHHDLSEIERRETDIQMFYNATKEGVNTFDQMCAKANCIRKTRRWPLCLFYGILNIIMVNSYILYSSMSSSKMLTRRRFLREVALDFCAPLVKHRFYTSTMLSKGLRLMMAETFKLVELSPRTSLPCGHVKLPKRVRCKSCPSKDDHKTNTACSRCKKPVCLQHQTVLCPNCVQWL